MRKAAAVIFDMDGVIVYSEPRHEQAFLEVVRSIGYGDNHGLQFADYVGRSDQELWVDFIKRHKPRQTLEELLAMKRERVVEILRRDQPVFDGLPELVEKLDCEFSLAVASGSERIVVEEVLALKDLRRFFLAVVTAADVKSGKPAPDIFLRAAELVGVAPEDCWVIEDSKPGVAAGLAARMRVIAVTNTHGADELAHANHVVRSYGEIAELLLA
jgi:HAD superfamily hydrolase (TIGR01509 family)